MATEKRLIDAEALKKAVRMWPRTKQPVLFYIGTVLKGIEEAPTVDAVEVVHGRWCFMGTWEECSICGRALAVDDERPNYCPNCGAKMDK